MLTFENSQGYLKDGKLKADDGTILGIDGEWPENAIDRKIPVHPGIC
jgi:hypothetical protein